MPSINTPAPGRRSRTIIALLLATTIIGGGSLTLQHQNAIAAEATNGAIKVDPQTTVVANPAGFADLVAKVKPAVVNVATTARMARGPQGQMPQIPPGSPFAEMFKHFGEQQQSQAKNALGSGFIVDASGYIVTNNHVIDGATKIMVTLADGTSYPATVKGRDPKTDVALLKINAPQPLPFVEFGDSDKAREGEWVIAVGNPFGLGGTVTAGIISAHGRNINEGPYDNFLQIDAPINPGNSGGPLFDQSGKVIGIDSAIYSPTGGSVGIGFAIPSSTASKVVAQLKDHGTVSRGWLGIAMQPITPALARALGRDKPEGVVVDKIEPNSPAAKADLQVGDVITSFDGKAIRVPRDLAMAVAGVQAGNSAKMVLSRDGREQTVDVKIGSAPGEKSAAVDAKSTEDTIGLALAPLSDEAKSELGLEADARGVVVAEVTPDSRAADSGVRPGDVIVKVGSEAVTSPSDVANRLHAAERAKRASVPLLVMRQGTMRYLALELDAA